MRYYPFSDHIVGDVMRRTCSEHGGILRSMIAAPARRYSDDVRLLSVSGQMPNYHKVLFDGPVNVNYHLTGYGLYQEEATIRLVGEAIDTPDVGIVGMAKARQAPRAFAQGELERWDGGQFASETEGFERVVAGGIGHVSPVAKTVAKHDARLRSGCGSCGSIHW